MARACRAGSRAIGGMQSGKEGEGRKVLRCSSQFQCLKYAYNSIELCSQ